MKLLTILAIMFLSIMSSLSYGADDFRIRVSQTEESYSGDDDLEAEAVFGRELAARILGREKAMQDNELTIYVNKVGKGVAQFANRPEVTFRFAVLDSDDINAYSSTAGYIFITKGALKKMEDEAELAAVLAHEIAHVTERHIVKALNIKGTDTSPLSGFAKIIGGSAETMRTVFMEAVDKAIELLFEKGLKKEDEYDSDRIAIIMADSAGYDPSALKRYMMKISEDNNRTETLNGTHPSFGDRIQRIDAVMAENQLHDIKKAVLKERFHENVRIR